MMFLRRALALCAILSLFAGITLPVMQFDRFYFFSDQPSILALVAGLWKDGDSALAILVFMLSVAFPLLKTKLLCLQEFFGFLPRGFLDRALPHLSKWSMVDVMLVAIAIFAAKSSGLASISALPGLWFYACSALLTGLMLRGSTPRSDIRSAQNSRE